MPKENKTIRLKVNVPRVFEALAKNQVSAVTMGFDMIIAGLNKIGQEAFRIGNSEIIRELYYLGMVELNEEQLIEHGIKEQG